MDNIQDLLSHVQSGNMDLMWAELYQVLDDGNVTSLHHIRGNY